VLTSYTMAPHTQQVPLLNYMPSASLETEEEEKILVALPGLEPGLSALRGRRVNQLHHNARTAYPQEDVRSSASINYTKHPRVTQLGAAGGGSV
jgi:hypothetical protein